MNTYTVEQIKKEALMLCDVADGDDIGGLSYNELLGIDKYAVFLRGMDSAINRCLMRFVEERVLPIKEIVINFDNNENGDWLTIDIDDYTSDEIDCILSVDLYKGEDLRYQGIRHYYNNGIRKLSVPALSKGCKYKVHYRYVPKMIDPFGHDNYAEIVDVDNKFAALIPYYVFGEVYRTTEPNIANTNGTEYFEQRLAQMLETYDETQTTMGNIFKEFN